VPGQSCGDEGSVYMRCQCPFSPMMFLAVFGTTFPAISPMRPKRGLSATSRHQRSQEYQWFFDSCGTRHLFSFTSLVGAVTRSRNRCSLVSFVSASWLFWAWETSKCYAYVPSSISSIGFAKGICYICLQGPLDGRSLEAPFQWLLLILTSRIRNSETNSVSTVLIS
jgi:hypothetical protein